MAFVLKLPHSHLSAVTTINSVGHSTGRSVLVVNKGWVVGATLDVTRCKSLDISAA